MNESRTEHKNINSISINSEQRYKLVNDGDRWHCVRCGNCCHGTFEEDWLKFVGTTTDPANGSDVCIYLDLVGPKPACRIYEGRPNACRAFPFSLRKGESGKFHLVIHSKCQGFGTGRVIDIPQKIRLCLRHTNREFHKRMRFDFSSFDQDRGVILVK